MSMEFGNDNEIRGGGGGALMGLLAGSALNRDRDDGKTTLLAAIVFVIVFIIAIIAFAMMFRDNRRDNSTDYAALLTPIIAAKTIDGNGCSNSNFDMLEIKQKLEHNEDRAVARETQHEIAAQGKSFMEIGFGLSGQIRDNEKTNLENFGELKGQLGMQGIALQQLLQKSNNEDIIQGVISRLCGAQRVAC